MVISGYSQNFRASMYFTSKSRKNVIIPFRLINNLIVIPLHINNSGVLYFILDSGVRTPIITELNSRDSITVRAYQKQKIHGLGKGDPIEVLYSPDNDFSILDIVHSNLNAYVLQNNVFKLSSKMGTNINGLIGYDVFSSFIVEIDYIKERLILHNPEKYRYRKSKRVAQLPFIIQNKKSYIHTKIEQEDGSVLPVKLLIDTGSSLALWLSLSSDKQLILPSNYQDSYLGKGLNGDIYGKLGRIKSLYIGQYQLKNPTAAFPDSSSVMNTVRLDGRNGSVGAEVLRRFRVTIDYHNKIILFIPNHNIRDKFEYNMSGLEFTVPIPGLPVFAISRIKEGSPADSVGLEVGDQLLFLNNHKNTELTLNEIHTILQSKPGRKIKLIVQRDNEKITYRFALKKEL